MTTDDKTHNPAPAFLSTERLAEIRERDRGDEAAESIADYDQPTIDRRALLAHLDALTPRAVDGEALGRAAWVARADAPKWGIPEERVAEHMRASFDNQPDDERARYTRIGTRLHAIGYAAGAVAMTGEGDDPAVEGAVYILMERHDRELREAHAAGRSEGEAAESETTRHLIDARNLAQRTAEDAHREIARLTAELADTDRLVAAAIDTGAADRARAMTAEATVERLTAELAEARAAEARSVDALNAAIRMHHEGVEERAEAESAARREGAREEREAAMAIIKRAKDAPTTREAWLVFAELEARGDAAPVEGEDGAT